MIKSAVAIILLIWPICAFAAPAITGYSGTITDNGDITISGSAFGTGPAAVEWLGGTTGNIESGANNANFSRTNWIQDGNNPWPENYPKYSTAQAHSGSKSIYCNPTGTSWNSVMVYHLPTAITSSGSLFISQWVRITKTGSSGQWKMWRFNDYNSITDPNTPGLVFFDWTNGLQICGNTSSWSYTGLDSELNPISTQSTWFRLDVYITCSLNSTGSVVMRKYIPGVSRETGTLSNYSTFGVSSEWNYLIWQNYCGNGLDSLDIYYDDIYISPNSQARVEIGNNSTYENCTHLEIQPTSSWASENITCRVNRGSFGASSTAYLFVIDSTGAVSSGYAITFGDTPPTMSGATCSGCSLNVP